MKISFLLKGFDQNLSTREKKKKKDWHLMKSEGEGIPFNPVVPLESQMIITIKKVENNNQ